MSPKVIRKETDETAELLKNLLIVQMALEGVPHHDIRKIARCSMNRVTEIAGLLENRSKKTEK